MKSIPPGYAILLMPFYINFYPRKESVVYTKSFIEHMVYLAHDHLSDELINSIHTIPCKLVVDTLRLRDKKSMPFSQQYYNATMGDGTENAMPIIFECDENCIENYLQTLKDNGIDERGYFNTTYIPLYKNLIRDARELKQQSCEKKNNRHAHPRLLSKM